MIPENLTEMTRRLDQVAALEILEFLDEEKDSEEDKH